MNPVWTDFLTSRLPGSQVKLYHCYEVKSRWCLHTHPTKSKRNRMLPSQLTPGAPEISPQLESTTTPMNTSWQQQRYPPLLQPRLPLPDVSVLPSSRDRKAVQDEPLATHEQRQERSDHVLRGPADA